jgi:hypothetical protein
MLKPKDREQVKCETLIALFKSGVTTQIFQVSKVKHILSILGK